MNRDDAYLAGIGVAFVATAALAVWAGGFWGGLILGGWIGGGVGVLIGGLAHAASHRDDGQS